MTNEVLIGKLYDIIDEVTRLGGEQERTSIVPGILVADANPSDLPTGYIKIVNPRDGTYVPCLTVNGLVVSDNDLVNVLFTKGTEPIALSQSAGSPSSSIKVYQLWESDFGAVAWQTDASGHLSATGKDLTTTGDISANDITASGNVLLTSGATAVAGDGGSEPSLGTSASGGRWGNIYLTSASFINALGNMDISTGPIGSEVRMIQLLNAAQDVLELGGIDGDDVDVNVSNGQVFIRGSDGFVGINNQSPQEPLHVGPGTDASGIGSTVIYASNAGTTTISARDSTNDVEVFMLAASGIGLFGTFTSVDFELRANNIGRLFIESTTGDIGINTGAPLGKLHIKQGSTTAAVPVLYIEQLDVSEEMFEFATTIGVGNAIEAAGAKTLTTTHFIKVTLPGALTRYIPVGTIA